MIRKFFTAAIGCSSQALVYRNTDQAFGILLPNLQTRSIDDSTPTQLVTGVFMCRFH